MTSPVTPAATAEVTLREAPPPHWVTAFFHELDARTSGAGFDILADDADAQLGVHRWRGREAIREGLRAPDTGADSRHEVHEFWDGGPVKILRGELVVTARATGEVVRSAIGHFLYMDAHDPTKVRRWVGAFGPTA